MAKVDIIIYRKKRPHRGQTQRRGPIVPFEQPEYLPRRLSKKFITFYDLGRKWDGSAFSDYITQTIDPVYDFSDPAGLGFWEATHDPSLTELETLRDSVIDYPIADIETKHPKASLDEGKYVLKLQLGSASNTADTDARWTADGWKVTQSELDAMSDFKIGGSDSLVMSATLTGASKDHITSVYDPSASPVSYNPRVGDKFFLMPSMMRPEGTVQYIDWADSHGLGFHALRVVYAVDLYDYCVFPREPLLSGGAYEFLETSPGRWVATLFPDADFTKNYNATQFFQTFGSNRVRQEAVQIVGSSYSWHITYVGTGYPPSEFFPSSLPPAGATSSWQLHCRSATGAGGSQPFTGTGSDDLDAVTPSGALLAIIKRGSTVFYVWK